MTSTTALSDFAIHLHPADQVAIARCEIPAGTTLSIPHGTLTTRHNIPAGHKLAITAIEAGAPILRYGYPIGVAAQSIAPGEWVHTHNVALPPNPRDLGYQLWQGTDPTASQLPSTFLGYRRADGQVGTRNFIAVISTVSCAAQTALAVAAHFTPERLAAYPNVDGVIAITHHSGCSITPDGLALSYLQRCLVNLANHPNLAGVIYVSLGCEVMQMSECMGRAAGTTSLDQTLAQTVPLLSIQELGGLESTRQAGIQAVEVLLPQANAVERKPQPLSALRIALQCGGSDGWSGVTANPLLGMTMDALIRQGGCAVLAETPEIYGAEQLLLSRVKNATAAQKLVRQIRWWEAQAALLGFSLDNNPTPGNKAGGLTTIYEKSLGAVAKGGSAPLAAVYDYAERITSPGLVFMDSPGNDPLSITGQLAGGCNMIVFTTGRGSVFGSSLAPTIKIASNSALYRRMQADMDFNAGALLEGLPIETARDQLLQQIMDAASGQRTCSEQSGFRQAEFIPWQPGAVL